MVIRLDGGASEGAWKLELAQRIPIVSRLPLISTLVLVIKDMPLSHVALVIVVPLSPDSCFYQDVGETAFMSKFATSNLKPRFETRNPPPFLALVLLLLVLNGEVQPKALLLVAGPPLLLLLLAPLLLLPLLLLLLLQLLPD